MSKKHQKVLESIFSDHISGNIHWKEIEALLKHIGATFSETKGARLLVRLNGAEITLHRPHHRAAMSKIDIHNLRRFIQAANINQA
jgi:hypothetical protein